MSFHFQDRSEGGRLLAEKLRAYAGRTDVVVLAIPRGGVPVAHEVAEELKAPLEVFVVRKLGVPGHEELAMGAIASGGICFWNDEVVRASEISPAAMEYVKQREERELARREQAFGAGRKTDLRGKTAILIDDGLATGASMRAAVQAVRRQSPARVIVAIPVASADTVEQFREEADEMVCVYAPEEFSAVGEWYENFAQISDEEVRQLLKRAPRNIPPMKAVVL